jgi:WYL domain
VQDEPLPVPLDGGDVLDQPAERELAGGGPLPGPSGAMWTGSESSATRFFRLDRVTKREVTPTGARFRPREIPGGDAAEFVRRTISSAPTTYEVVAMVAAGGGVVKEKIGRWATVEDLGPERCRVRMTPPEAGDWPVIALGLTDADFEVVSPAVVADRVRAWGDRFTRAAGSRAQVPGNGHLPLQNRGSGG